MTGKCWNNINYAAAAGAAAGGAMGNYMGGAIGYKTFPWIGQVIGRNLYSGGVIYPRQIIAAAIGEGIGSGVGEKIGGY